MSDDRPFRLRFFLFLLRLACLAHVLIFLLTGALSAALPPAETAALVGGMVTDVGQIRYHVASGVTAMPPSESGLVESRLFSLDAVFDEVIPLAV